MLIIFMLWPSRKELDTRKCWLPQLVGNTVGEHNMCAHTCLYTLALSSLKYCCACACSLYAADMHRYFFFSFNTLSFPLPLSISRRFNGSFKTRGRKTLGIDDSIAREVKRHLYHSIQVSHLRSRPSSPELKNSWMK